MAGTAGTVPAIFVFKASFDTETIPSAASRYHSRVPTPASETQLIHARGLTKRFKLKSAETGWFTAVDAIDFDVAPGEAFGFLGPTAPARPRRCA